MLSHNDDAFDVFRQLYVSSSDGEDDKDDKDDAPPTAVQVDLPKFIGKWAQVYASLGPKYTFELGGRDVARLQHENMALKAQVKSFIEVCLAEDCYVNELWSILSGT